jgi:hypothetical protein
MGKVVSFQNRRQLEALTNSLLLKIKEGKFNSLSSSSKGILAQLETADVNDITAFLKSITPIVEVASIL